MIALPPGPGEGKCFAFGLASCIFLLNPCSSFEDGGVLSPFTVSGGEEQFALESHAREMCHRWRALYPRCMGEEQFTYQVVSEVETLVCPR